MKLRTLEQNGVTILEVYGDLQFSNWHELVNKASLLINQGKDQLIIDWDNVGYVDSSALGALVAVDRLFKKTDSGRAVIYTSNPEHLFILQQAHFHSFIEIYQDLQKASESFSRGLNEESENAEKKSRIEIS